MTRKLRNWLCYHNFHAWSEWEAYPHARIVDEMGLQVAGYCEMRHCYRCPISECEMKLRDVEIIQDTSKAFFIEL